MAQQASPFPWARKEFINHAIIQLKARSMRGFRHGLTREDLLNLLAKPKDREMLARVAKITAAANYTQVQEIQTKYGDYENLTLYIELPGSVKKGFLIPNYVSKTGLQTDLPEDTKARVKVAFERVIKNDLDWRYVKAVTDALMNRCYTASQVKLVMPTIVTLFRTQIGQDVPVDNDYADRIYAQSVPREMPALPPLLRQWAIDVGRTITLASMLPFETTAPEKPDEFNMRVVIADRIGVPWEPNYDLPVVS